MARVTKSEFGQLAWMLAKYFVQVAVVWTALNFVARFSELQSIVLALVFVGLYRWISVLDKSREFQPYSIAIKVTNPHDLIFDFKLVDTEEQWKHLVENITDESVLRCGINFTVLAVDENGLPKIVFWDDKKKFASGIPDFEVAISEINKPRKGPSVGFFEWSPKIYFGYKHAAHRGYGLGLVVPEQWLKQVSTEVLSSVKIETDRLGTTHLLLTSVPYGEIGMDYAHRKQDRKTELEKLNWKISDSYDPDVPVWNAFLVEQKYFSVSFKPCEM